MVVCGTQRKLLTLHKNQSSTLNSNCVNDKKWQFNDSRVGTVIRSKTLDGAAGSSYVEIADTKVVCSVTGPKEHASESTEGVLNVSLNGAESSIRHMILSTLKSVVCLKKIARAEIVIELNVLVDNGEVLAASLMAASVALITAKIQCFDVILACSFPVAMSGTEAMSKQRNSKVGEFSSGHNNARVTMAIAPSLAQVVCVDVSNGAITRNCLKNSLDDGFNKCLELYELMSKALHDWVSKSV